MKTFNEFILIAEAYRDLDSKKLYRMQDRADSYRHLGDTIEKEVERRSPYRRERENIYKGKKNPPHRRGNPNSKAYTRYAGRLGRIPDDRRYDPNDLQSIANAERADRKKSAKLKTKAERMQKVINYAKADPDMYALSSMANVKQDFLKPKKK